MKFYQTILHEKLAERKRRNPRFSLRAFSRTLEISPAQLSRLMNGKKKLSINLASRLIDKLSLDEESASQLLNEMLSVQPKGEAKNSQVQVLSADEFALISDWTHFAVLSLAHLKNNQARPKWIAQKLGIEISEASTLLRRLIRMKLIEVRNHQFSQTTKPLVTVTDIPSEPIRKYHKQCLRLAESKLDSVPVQLREYSSTTVAVNPDKIEKAKKMIFDFQNKLCKEVEDHHTSEVYTLSVQFFPVTVDTPKQRKGKS